MNPLYNVLDVISPNEDVLRRYVGYLQVPKDVAVKALGVEGSLEKKSIIDSVHSDMKEFTGSVLTTEDNKDNQEYIGRVKEAFAQISILHHEKTGQKKAKELVDGLTNRYEFIKQERDDAVYYTRIPKELTGSVSTDAKFSSKVKDLVENTMVHGGFWELSKIAKQDKIDHIDRMLKNLDAEFNEDAVPKNLKRNDKDETQHEYASSISKEGYWSTNAMEDGLILRDSRRRPVEVKKNGRLYNIVIKFKNSPDYELEEIN